jgi:hypothetical protein
VIAPVIKVTRPFVPVVIDGVPVSTILPPVAVPAAVFFPAFKVTALLLVSVVEIAPASVKLPVNAAIFTVELDVIP